MVFKTILVSLNDVLHAPALQAVALTIARDFDAHLEGLYVIPGIEVYATGALPIISEARREHFKKQQDSVRSAFEAAMVKQVVRGNFQVVDSPRPSLANIVIERGREADLIVVGQWDPASDFVIDSDLVESISVSSGRPTLVVGCTGQPNLKPDLAIVGWNGSREAARAAFDSISLLKRVKEVRIVCVNPQKQFYDKGFLPGAGLAEALARHGVNAVVEALSSEQEAGEALLTKVNDTGAGLLIMGAYGHTRLREFILGGATHTVLSKMTCPVLFSH